MLCTFYFVFFFFSSRRRHTRLVGDWSSDVCSSDLACSGEPPAPEWPRPNVWLGVSVEDQATADERVPLLLETPAVVRWVSAEPLLGPINLERFMWPTCWHWDGRYRTPEEALAAGARDEKKPQALVAAGRSFLKWVVVGGESGPGARPFDLDWGRKLRHQCAQAGVPLFTKQLGSAPRDPLRMVGDGRVVLRDRKGGDPSE